MQNFKKVLSLALAAVMVLGCLVGLCAEEEPVLEDGGTGETLLVLTAEAATFSVIVPTSIPIVVKADGETICPSNLEIVNESTAAVKVTDVAMKDGTWSLVPYDGTEMSKERVDAKKLAFQMKVGEDTTATTTTGDQSLAIAQGGWLMEKDATLSIDCDAKASAVSTAISATNAASVVFTIGWAPAQEVTQ